MEGKEMKATMLLFCLVVGLLIVGTSFSVAQPWPASQDTVVVAGGLVNEGSLEAAINGDTTAAGARVHPNRVYKLEKNTIYTQYAAIDIKNPTGALIIVGERGGLKPVIIYTGINGVNPGNATTGEVNVVQGSIKLDNLHIQCMFTNDGTWRNNLFSTSTANNLPQYVDVNDCFFEFMMLDTFSSDGYTAGAKFKFTNCYFRNLFNPNQWWGGRVFYCKRAIDTVWVENCTVTGGGLIFLQQNSLCKFAYFNHNTIINSNKYWLLGSYYLEGYWVNNLFINQNWVGEDYENVATGGQDPDNKMLMGTINLDTLTVHSGRTTPHINVQPEYLLGDGTIDPAKCGLDKIKAFVSNNILWTDTVALEAYYRDRAIGGFGPYGGAYPGVSPSSWLTWTSPANPPYPVVNVPSIWMNSRTAGLFSGTYPMIIQKDNHINVAVTTVTPAIASAAVADQMALWNAGQWGVPGITPHAITQSGYIFGDYNPLTIPGVKTEDGDGIAKFTDLNDNWAQSGTVRYSTIDGLPIGALHWTNAIDTYNSAAAYAAVTSGYCGDCNGVENNSSGLPLRYELLQNYPNPFNPTTTINFTLAKASDVKLAVYNVLGQKVATLVDTRMSAGQQSVVFDASRLASGVYFYHIDAGSFNSVKKMMLLK
jgi:hypothetical protein